MFEICKLTLGRASVMQMKCPIVVDDNLQKSLSFQIIISFLVKHISSCIFKLLLQISIYNNDENGISLALYNISALYKSRCISL